MGGISNWWQQVATPSDFFFFRLILGFLRDRIQDFGVDLMGRVMSFVGMIALTVLTLWVLVQGYRIVTGQSREAMMGLVVNAIKATLIVGIATSMAMFGSGLHDFLTQDLNNHITYVVTGKNESPSAQIDESLGWMQMALSGVDVLDVAQDSTIDNEKSRAMWMLGLGMGGPALVGGSLLLMYEVALALFIGLGPIFILCLLFESTKQMFHKWLWYGIGTMFSMAVLAAMVSISLDLVIRVAGAFWANAALGNLIGSDFSDGISSQALQQGGMGMILTTLMITTPPMAAMFFQGTLGHFAAYSAMGGAGGIARDNAGRSPGTPGYQPGYQPAAVTNQYSQVSNTQSRSSEGGLNSADYSNRAATGNYGNSNTQTLSHELANQVAPGQSRIVSGGNQTPTHSPPTQPASTRTPPSTGGRGDGNV